MRPITTHEQGVVNNQLQIFALDQPGPGGANQRYLVSGFNTLEHPAARDANGNRRQQTALHMLFQSGDPAEFGINGITNEVLLSIVIDRLEGFQHGPFGCDQNQIALERARDALEALHERTRDRIIRDVEGKFES